MVDLNKGATVELVKALSDDIRTLPDGTKASSAGAAVRGQTAALKTQADDLKINLNSSTNNATCRLFGGIFKPYFHQGSIDRISGTDYLENTYTQKTMVSTDCNTPIYLNNGDIITIDSNFYIRILNKVTIDTTGILLIENIQTPTTPYTIQKDGLYCLIVSKVDNTNITPSDVDGKVFITTTGEFNKISEEISANNAAVRGQTAALKTQADDLKINLNSSINNATCRLFGGIFKPYFHQGSIDRISGTDYLENTYTQKTMVSTDCNTPIYLNNGDIITIDSNFYIRALDRFTIDTTGILLIENIQTPTTPYTIQKDGLYGLIVSKIDNSRIIPSDLDGKVFITTTGESNKISEEISANNNESNIVISKLYNQIRGGLYGDRYAPIFIQGSIDKISGTDYLENTHTQTTIVSTELEKPLILNRGDVVTIDSNFYIRLLDRFTVDATGNLLIETIQTPTTPYTIQKDGLYGLIVSKIGNSRIIPSDLDGKIFINGAGKVDNNSSIKYQRTNNPYGNLDWSGRQIKTTCHSHCKNSGDFRNMQSAGYEAIIPTNYRPSKPYYPLKDYFPDIVNIESILSAPNSEISGFNFNSSNDRYADVSPLGSYMAIGSADTATYKGGIDNFIAEARKARAGYGIGGVIINHPNYSGADVDIIKDVLKENPDVLGIEIYNYDCEHSEGNGYSIDVWDAILSDGIQCYGFASPDHMLQRTITEFNEPFGFIHVIMPCNTEFALLSAISDGHFYATLYNDGLKINSITVSNMEITVNAIAETTNNQSIKFITAKREISFSGLNGTFTATNDDVYVRAEVRSGDNVAYTNAIML